MISSSQYHGTVPFKRSEEKRREFVGKPLEKLGEKDQCRSECIGHEGISAWIIRVNYIPACNQPDLLSINVLGIILRLS